jgi:tetratricopeptide (TPR) repeat protein
MREPDTPRAGKRSHAAHHHDHHHRHHHEPPPRIRRRTIVAIGILIVALGLAAAAIFLGPSGGLDVGGGDAASDYLLRCSQSLERGDYADAFGFCQIALAKPARLRIHVAAARRMALAQMAQGQTGAALAVMTILEDRLQDRSSGAIRGAILHAAGRFAEAMAAYRACNSANPLLDDLRREAEATRRIPFSEKDLIMGISRLRCA